MKIFLVSLLIIHGIIHLLGFVKAFRFSEVKSLTLPISKISGIIWLISCLIFLVSSLLLILNIDEWWITSFISIVFSQALIFKFWKDAKFGTIANLIILIFVLIKNSPSVFIFQ